MFSHINNIKGELRRFNSQDENSAVVLFKVKATQTNFVLVQNQH